MGSSPIIATSVVPFTAADLRPPLAAMSPSHRSLIVVSPMRDSAPMRLEPMGMARNVSLRMPGVGFSFRVPQWLGDIFFRHGHPLVDDRAMVG